MLNPIEIPIAATLVGQNESKDINEYVIGIYRWCNLKCFNPTYKNLRNSEKKNSKEVKLCINKLCLP